MNLNITDKCYLIRAIECRVNELENLQHSAKSDTDILKIRTDIQYYNKLMSEVKND